MGRSQSGPNDDRNIVMCAMEKRIKELEFQLQEQKVLILPYYYFSRMCYEHFLPSKFESLNCLFSSQKSSLNTTITSIDTEKEPSLAQSE